MSPHPARSLSVTQIAILIGFGATLWFGAALLIPAIEPMGALRYPGVILFYVLLIPGTWPFILLARKAATLAREQTLLTVAIPTATASLLDANALIWSPTLYGANPPGAGAAILWGVGVTLVLGVVMNRN